MSPISKTTREPASQLWNSIGQSSIASREHPGSRFNHCPIPTGLAGMAVTGVSCRYVDQIEIIENEFRIEKVYYIHGSEQAETLWAEEYGKKGVTWTRLAGESPFFLNMKRKENDLLSPFFAEHRIFNITYVCFPESICFQHQTDDCEAFCPLEGDGSGKGDDVPAFLGRFTRPLGCKWPLPLHKSG